MVGWLEAGVGIVQPNDTDSYTEGNQWCEFAIHTVMSCCV
jgi:hypothetical protein